MRDADLVVVFDLLEAGFKDWWFAAFGLIFVALGLLMVVFSRFVMVLLSTTSHPRFYKIFSRLFLGFAILWTVLSFAMTYGSYLLLRGEYIDGNFEVVEGQVEDYQPMPSSGHPRESFTVAGREFSYSDYSITPGYNNARALGGPIDAGVYVRISHVGGEIVRLEVERSVAESVGARPGRFLWPSDFKLPEYPEGSPADLMFRYFWIVLLVVIIGYAAIWRWRGRVHIARDPSLRQGYSRLTRGLVLWGSVPILVGGVASIFGNIKPNELFGFSVSLSVWSQIYYLVWFGVIAKWMYWTFFQDGAAKMARHPGLIDSEKAAKLWTLVIAASVLFQFVQSLV